MRPFTASPQAKYATAPGLLVDLEILRRTVLAVVRRQGVYREEAGRG